MLDEETYTIARFGNDGEAEVAQRHLRDAGVEAIILPEPGFAVEADVAASVPVLLVCHATDRIYAITVLERARVL